MDFQKGLDTCMGSGGDGVRFGIPSLSSEVGQRSRSRAQVPTGSAGDAVPNAMALPTVSFRETSASGDAFQGLEGTPSLTRGQSSPVLPVPPRSRGGSSLAKRRFCSDGWQALSQAMPSRGSSPGHDRREHLRVPSDASSTSCGE